jgi:hypothetical protein
MSKNELTNFNDNQGEFLIYTLPDGNSQIQVKLINESIWLPQAQIASLFGVQVPDISKHIKNIYETGELSKNTTVSKMETVVNRGFRGEVNEEIDFYNLDMIISVGYRVNSSRATQFRQWATQRLREYIIKGFTINKEYLKDPAGKDYFDELLKEIREIRASEKRFYAKIRDIFLFFSDYDSINSKDKNTFFAIIQNKMFHAVTGNTAAEIKHSRVDAEKPHCGTLTFKGRKVALTDAQIAKNYLTKDEIEQLEMLTVMFLDYAELQAKNRKIMHVTDWINKLDNILQLNDMEILKGAGKITTKMAENKVKIEFGKYDKEQKELEKLEAEVIFAQEVEELQAITKQIQAKNEPLSDFNKKLMQAQKFDPST